MKDYWSKLKLNECWSARERYNLILNYIDEKLGATEEEQTVEPTDDPVVEPTDDPVDNPVEQNDNPTEEVQTSNISVSVTDGENGVGNVDVVLSVTGSETTYTGKTGNAGGCTIKDVPYGEYDVTATAEGYVTGESTITVDGETEELNIVLTLEEEPEEEPTG